MSERLSEVTALAYPLAGAAVLAVSASPATFVLAAALLFLGVGTFAYHHRLTEDTRSLDHAGMNAATATLATLAVGGPWWMAVAAGAAAAVVLEYIMDLPNRHIVGIFIWMTIAALVGAGGSVWALLGTASMGVGFVFWQMKEDWAHAAWHLLTALGFFYFGMGVV